MCLSENISARIFGKRAAFLLIHCRGALAQIAHTERVTVQTFGKYLIEDGLQLRTAAQKHELGGSTFLFGIASLQDGYLIGGGVVGSPS